MPNLFQKYLKKSLNYKNIQKVSNKYPKSIPKLFKQYPKSKKKLYQKNP